VWEGHCRRQAGSVLAAVQCQRTWREDEFFLFSFWKISSRTMRRQRLLCRQSLSCVCLCACVCVCGVSVSVSVWCVCTEAPT
jgi:hypothetical protein